MYIHNECVNLSLIVIKYVIEPIMLTLCIFLICIKAADFVEEDNVDDEREDQVSSPGVCVWGGGGGDSSHQW